MEYTIKMDGRKHKFGEATRFTKDGKGRFDLIPVESVIALINAIERMPDEISGLDEKINAYILYSAFKGCYGTAIGYMMITKYGDYSRTYDSTNIIRFLLPKMLAELAVHFQKGAEKYGPHNCEKGIPLWSFRDSGLRHMCQWLDGKNDENHFIAAIWNFMMAMWTIEVHPERCDDEIYTDTDAGNESDDSDEETDDSIEDDELDQEEDTGHYLPEYNDFEIDPDEIKSDVRAALEQMKQSKHGPTSHDIKIFINKMANWVSDFDGELNYKSTMSAIRYDLCALLDDRNIDFTCYDTTYSSMVPLFLDNMECKWNDDDRLYYTVYESIQKMRRIMNNVVTGNIDKLNQVNFVFACIESGFNVYDEMPGTDLIKYIGYSEDVRSIIDMIDDESDKEEFVGIINKFNDDNMFSDICSCIAKEKHH